MQAYVASLVEIISLAKNTPATQTPLQGRADEISMYHYHYSIIIDCGTASRVTSMAGQAARIFDQRPSPVAVQNI